VKYRRPTPIDNQLILPSGLYPIRCPTLVQNASFAPCSRHSPFCPTSTLDVILDPFDSNGPVLLSLTFDPASDSVTAGIKSAKSVCTTTEEAVAATLAGSSPPYLDMLLATELFWRVLKLSTRSGTSFRLCLEGIAERGLKRSDGLQSGKRVDRRVRVGQVDVVEGGVDARCGRDGTLRRRSEGLLDQVPRRRESRRRVSGLS
jgi:hypothetical protein